MSIFNSSTGIQGDPYKIYTEDDLFEFASYSGITNTNNNYQLQNDITLTRDWTPVGTSSRRFKGQFDGNGYTIRNININSNGATHQGLFGYTDSAKIKYLTLENVTINNPSTNTGGLIGYMYNGNVENCYVKNIRITTDANNTRYGGMLGTTGGNRCNVSHNIVENVTINGGGTLGGFGGYLNNATFKNCLVIGELSLNSNPANANASEVFGFGYVIARYSNAYLSAVQSSEYPMSNENAENIRIKNISNPTDTSEYITDPNNTWRGEIWNFGEDTTWNKRDGELPHFTHFGTPINPVKIYTYEDIQTKMMNSNYEFGLFGAFKLMNDIEFPYIIDSGGANNPNLLVSVMASNFYTNSRQTFSGWLDGDGYSVTGIKQNRGYNINASDYEVNFFYTLNGAVVKNLGIHWEDVESGYYDGTIRLLANSASYCLIENVRIKIDRAYELETVSALPSNPTYSIFRNIYIDFGDVTVYRPSDESWITYINDYGMSSSQAPEFTNIAIRFRNRLSAFPSRMFYNGTRSEVTDKINGVVMYIEGYTNTSHNMKLTSIPTLSAFLSGTHPSMASYQNDWIFDGENDPIQKAFVKIVSKIEQRLINAYSLISKGAVKRYKGRLNSVKSFSKKYTGKDNRLVKKIYRTLSKALRSVSKVSRKAKAGKVIKSFSRKVISRIPTIFKKKIEQVKGFAKKSFSKLTNKKKITRINKSWSLNMGSKLIKYRDVIRTSAKSFSKKMSSKTLASIISKMVIRVKSFSKPLRSKVSAFSNKFTRIKVIVKGYANDIVSNVERKAKRKLIVKSFSEKFRALTQSFFKIASPKNVMAIITHKFSKISISKRFNKTSTDTKKHKTNINQIDDGGED